MKFSDNDRFRIALVGCGYWGSKHVWMLNAVHAMDGVVLVDSRGYAPIHSPGDRLQSLLCHWVSRYCPTWGNCQVAHYSPLSQRS